MDYTAGPWMLTDQHLSKEGPPVMDVHDRGQSIARIYVESDTDVANARLIAAAPEMLEALQAIEKQLSIIYPQASTLSYVRAAIASALGQEVSA